MSLAKRCEKADTLVVDLFVRGTLFKRSIELPLFYKEYPRLGSQTDLLEAARLQMQPVPEKVMGRVYRAERRPVNVNFIPWDRYGTYLSGEKPQFLESCLGILEHQRDYVAINLAEAPKDETLKMDVYWRGKLLKEAYELPIRYLHGERKFAESRVDLAEAIREAIPQTRLRGRDTTVQFMNRKQAPLTLPIDWKKRKAGVARLMARSDQIKELKNQWIAVNVEPVITVDGLLCAHCNTFDAVFKHEESNQFYCSKQCYLDGQ